MVEVLLQPVGGTGWEARRVRLEQDSPVVVGREDTSHRHSGGNAYFDCKVIAC